MGILKRILGICKTKPPSDTGCWDFKKGMVVMDLSRVPELSQPGGAIRLEGRGPFFALPLLKPGYLFPT